MVYDHMSLGQVLQRFLRDQHDVLEALRGALCGEEPVGAGSLMRFLTVSNVG